MADDERCMHELAPGTCSICSGRHRAEQLELAKEPHLSQCHDCGADIVWVRSERDKGMPIDAEPGGDPAKARFRKERAEYRDDSGRVVGIVHFVRDNELEANTRPLYCCHFDTCTERKKKETDARQG